MPVLVKYKYSGEWLRKEFKCLEFTKYRFLFIHSSLCSLGHILTL